MVRRVIMVLLWLLLGTLTSIAVAWGCALYGISFESGGYEHASEQYTAWWRAHVPRSWPGEPRCVMYCSGFGTDLVMMFELPSSDDPLWRGNNVLRTRAGLPLRCLEGHAWVDRSRQIARSEALAHVGPTWWHPPGTLPLQARWPGMIVNAAIYALLVARVWHTLHRGRRLVRKARGHCPVCNYDVRGSLVAGCPECGWNREDAHARTGARQRAD